MRMSLDPRIPEFSDLRVQISDARVIELHARRYTWCMEQKRPKPPVLATSVPDALGPRPWQGYRT